MTKQGLSLSVFTNENYKNLHYISSSSRSSMYDELEVNKSRSKNCSFNEGIFKSIEAIRNCKFTTCGFNNCIFEDVRFYKNQFKNSAFVNTPFNQSVFNSALFQNVMFGNDLIRSVKWTDIVFKNVSFKNIEIEGTTSKDIKFRNCEFKNVIITNSAMSQRLVNKLQKQDVTLEDIDTSI